MNSGPAGHGPPLYTNFRQRTAWRPFHAHARLLGVNACAPTPYLPHSRPFFCASTAVGVLSRTTASRRHAPTAVAIAAYFIVAPHSLNREGSAGARVETVTSDSELRPGLQVAAALRRRRRRRSLFVFNGYYRDKVPAMCINSKVPPTGRRPSRWTHAHSSYIYTLAPASAHPPQRARMHFSAVTMLDGRQDSRTPVCLVQRVEPPSPPTLDGVYRWEPSGCPGEHGRRG